MVDAKAGITNIKPKTPPLRLAWIIWGWGAVFYLVGFFLRLTPAVMTEELMQAFNINATALGNLSAFYFYSYVAMQIPTGILADRWGPRRTVGLLLGLGAGRSCGRRGCVPGGVPAYRLA